MRIPSIASWAICLCFVVQARASLVSAFTTDSEGWTAASSDSSVTGDYTLSYFYTNTQIYQPTGGNPGGYIGFISDPDTYTTYYLAPVAYLGDQSASYGGSIAYDGQDLPTGSDTVFTDVADIVLQSGSILLLSRDGWSQSAWTHESLALVPSNFQVGSLSGPTATEAQLQEVLGNLTSLRICGEDQDGPDSSGLDNVVLTYAPEPAVTCAGIGLVLTLMTKRRLHSFKGSEKSQESN